jgi:non-ribosomal peptide synthetase component E (peptide arylation enzyme)
MMMLSRAAARSLARRAPSNRSIALKSVIARNGSVIHAGIVKNVEKRTFASMAAGDALQLLADDNPHLEAIRYEYKNVKATYSKVNSWADMLATGLVEQGLIKGDVVLSWLPSHFVEQVCVFTERRDA